MKTARALLPAAILLALFILPSAASAETYQLSWDPVTLYSDGTAIETSKSVMYTAYWTTDPSMSPTTLKVLAASIVATSVTFDPAVQGMPRSTAVYFTAKTVLSTGEESGLSTALQWSFSNKKPTPPGQLKLNRIN